MKALMTVYSHKGSIKILVEEHCLSAATIRWARHMLLFPYNIFLFPYNMLHGHYKTPEIFTHPMGIKDISFIGLLSTTKEMYYNMNYDNIDVNDLMATMDFDCDRISLYKDQTFFVHTREEIILCLLVKPKSNDVFVYQAFQALVGCLDGVLKKWTVGRVEEKYDQLVIAFNEFSYNGVVLADTAESLQERIPKRTFENIGGIKVKKGFASIIHKAAGSLKNK